MPSASRYSAAVEGTSSNQSASGWVIEVKVESTTKPSCATSMAGASAWASEKVPYSRSARSQPATVPGTPALRPLQRASLKASGAPFSQKLSGCIAAGAISRVSIVVVCPAGVRMTMNPPPPIPHDSGSTTPSTAAAVTAASTALPPRRSAPIAACVATLSTVAAAPPVPVAVASGWCW